jgi:hypothetical protein
VFLVSGCISSRRSSNSNIILGNSKDSLKNDWQKIRIYKPSWLFY